MLLFSLKIDYALNLFLFFFFFVIRFRRQTHVTPKSYLSFIDGYKTIYKGKKTEIGELASRMKTGLDKLIEATTSVAELAKELVVKEQDLKVASVKADLVIIYFLIHPVPPIIMI